MKPSKELRRMNTATTNSSRYSAFRSHVWTKRRLLSYRRITRSVLNGLARISWRRMSSGLTMTRSLNGSQSSICSSRPWFSGRRRTNSGDSVRRQLTPYSRSISCCTFPLVGHMAPMLSTMENSSARRPKYSAASSLISPKESAGVMRSVKRLSPWKMGTQPSAWSSCRCAMNMLSCCWRCASVCRSCSSRRSASYSGVTRSTCSDRRPRELPTSSLAFLSNSARRSRTSRLFDRYDTRSRSAAVSLLRCRSSSLVASS
mmetsp:Transcript_11183/g.35607  ORF Transcript_11183/g.35607 Transcript_11183/m.35607 type:complete len:259 (-) Transcript_11183:181-957(-)